MYEISKTPEEIKKSLEPCECMDGYNCTSCKFKYQCQAKAHALLLVEQLEEEKKQLQKIICDQRRQLRLMHAMYEWALERLQKAKLNDRAHFQAWMRTKGYDPATLELPKRAHGHWIGLEYDGFADGCPVYDLWECSECGYEHKGEETTNYCPNCGAMMEEDSFNENQY